MVRPTDSSARLPEPHDHDDMEVVAVLHPGPDEVRRARALIDAIDRDPRIGAEEVLRRLRLPPGVLAAIGATGDFARGSSEYTSLLAVLLDTIAAGCTVRLVSHTPPAPVRPAAR
jgi:hypothetical protein